jgi:hypothetical protein
MYAPMDDMEKMIRGYSPMMRRINAPLRPGMTKVAPLINPAKNT